MMLVPSTANPSATLERPMTELSWNHTFTDQALAIHWGKSASWIRRRGELISWRGETWVRAEVL